MKTPLPGTDASHDSAARSPLRRWFPVAVLLVCALPLAAWPDTFSHEVVHSEPAAQSSGQATRAEGLAAVPVPLPAVRIAARSGFLVVDEDGAPVPQARVCCSDAGGNYSLGLTDQSGRAPVPERFAACPDCEVLAVAPGRAAERRRLDLKTATGVIEVRLRRGCSLNLTVVDEAAGPLADHRVRVRGADPNHNPVFEANLAATCIPVGEGHRDQVAFGDGPWLRTDDVGVVHFAGLEPGVTEVVVWRGDAEVLRTSIELDRPFCDRTVVVVPRRSLMIRVLDGDSVVAGSEAFLIAEPAGDVDQPEILAHAPTDSAGVAVLHNVSIPRELTVWACAGLAGRWGRSVPVAAPKADAVFDVALPPPGPPRRIHFVDPVGGPVRPGRIMITAERLPNLFEHVQELDGQQFVDCPVTFPGEALFVSASLAAGHESDLFSRAGKVLGVEDLSTVVQFRALRSGEGTGTLQIGLPVAPGTKAEVEVRGHRLQRRVAAQVVDGQVEIAGVREGALHMKVTVDGKVGTARATLAARGRVRVDPQLEVPASVQFSIQDPAQVDIAWALVTGEEEGSEGRVTIVRGLGRTNRTIQCFGVPPGRYFLVVTPRQADSPDMLHVPLEVRAGESMDLLDLPMAAFGPELRVEVPEHLRITRVWLNGGLDRSIQLRAVLPTARLRFRGLLPANYELIATDETGKVLAVGSCVVAADNATVTLRPQ